MDAGLDFSRQEITGDEPYSTWALWPNLCLVSPAPDRALHEAQQPSHCLERTDTCYPPEFKSEKFRRPNCCSRNLLIARIFCWSRTYNAAWSTTVTTRGAMSSMVQVPGFRNRPSIDPTARYWVLCKMRINFYLCAMRGNGFYEFCDQRRRVVDTPCSRGVNAGIEIFERADDAAAKREVARALDIDRNTHAGRH